MLDRLGLTRDVLNYYETPEYCFNDYIPERKDNMVLLILENKDIWFIIAAIKYCHINNTAADNLSEFRFEPLPASEVGANFEARIAEFNKKIKGIDGQIRATSERMNRLNKTQGKVEIATERRQCPAKYLSITLEINYEAQLNAMNARIAESENLLKNHEKAMDNRLNKMSLEYGIKSTDANRAISGMKEIFSNNARGDKYYTLYEHIDASSQTVKKRISQIETDLKEVDKTRESLVHQCLIQGRQIYKGLKKLSDNSRVKVQKKRRQTIKFDIPDNVDENIARVAIAQEIDKSIKEIVAKMSADDSKEPEINKITSRIVGSDLLLRKYTGVENILLKAYKIDQNPDNSGYRTWKQTQVNNSGAEKFLVYFAVILSLMAYARDEYESDDRKKNRSVLILDNSFGPISSKHVLEPMFEISRTYNVQMICLSDNTKSDIVSCFDLVIRVVVKPLFFSSKEHLIHDGDKRIEHGFYRSEQMNLLWKTPTIRSAYSVG